MVRVQVLESMPLLKGDGWTGRMDKIGWTGRRLDKVGLMDVVEKVQELAHCKDGESLPLF